MLRVLKRWMAHATMPAPNVAAEQIAELMRERDAARAERDALRVEMHRREAKKKAR